MSRYHAYPISNLSAGAHPSNFPMPSVGFILVLSLHLAPVR